jgi:hypothetical protein
LFALRTQRYRSIAEMEVWEQGQGKPRMPYLAPDAKRGAIAYSNHSRGFGLV